MEEYKFSYNFGLDNFLVQNNIYHFLTYSGTGENEEVTYYIKTADPNQLLVFVYKGYEEKRFGYRFSSMFYLFTSMEMQYEECIEDMLTGTDHFTFMNVCEWENVFDKGKIVPLSSCINEEEGSDE